jgi:hypothetical protein
MNPNKLFLYAILGIVVTALFYIALIAGLVWVAWHFIAKLW